MSGDAGSVLDKDAVREVLVKLASGRGFSEGALGIEQATNRICALQQPPRDIEEVALTVGCAYCGRTPGNRCYIGGTHVNAHPSRVRIALAGGYA